MPLGAKEAEPRMPSVQAWEQGKLDNTRWLALLGNSADPEADRLAAWTAVKLVEKDPASALALSLAQSRADRLRHLKKAGTCQLCKHQLCLQASHDRGAP